LQISTSGVVKAIIENPKESRKEFLIEQFRKAGNSASNVTQYQFWRHDNHPVELWSNKVIDEKIDYIHQNPVEAGLVFRAEDYIYMKTTRCNRLGAGYPKERGSVA
jgi:hypothetical protein